MVFLKKIRFCVIALLITILSFFVISATASNGKYLYKINDGELTIEYNGTDEPTFTIMFFIEDSNSDWGWSWLTNKIVTYSKKVSINVFDTLWPKLWEKTGKAPDTQNIFIQVFKGDKDFNSSAIIFGDIKTKFIVGEKEITIKTIKHWKSLGFDTIRIPVTWGDHIDKNGNVFPSWINRVQEVVDWCIDEDFYVILNTHHDSGAYDSCWIFATDESYNKYNARYKKLWEQIADRFKNYSEKLIFASPNEICQAVGTWGTSTATKKTYGAVLKWNQLFVDTVRKSGGYNKNRNIIVAGLNTSGSESILKNTTLPKDSAKKHLIFEIHSYEPTTFVYPGSVNADKNINRIFAKSGFNAEKILEHDIKAGKPFTVDETFKIKNNALAQIMIRLDYEKQQLNDAATITIE